MLVLSNAFIQFRYRSHILFSILSHLSLTSTRAPLSASEQCDGALGYTAGEPIHAVLCSEAAAAKRLVLEGTVDKEQAETQACMNNTYTHAYAFFCSYRDTWCLTLLCSWIFGGDGI